MNKKTPIMIITLFLLSTIALKLNSYGQDLSSFKPSLNISKEQERTLKEGSYILGFNEADTLKNANYKLDEKELLNGMNDGFLKDLSSKTQEGFSKTIDEYIKLLPNKLNKKLIKRMSYVLGVSFGKDFKSKFFPFYPKDFVKGIMDFMNGKDPEYDPKNIKVLDDFYTHAQMLKNSYSQNENLFVIDNKDILKYNEDLEYQIINSGKGSKIDFKKNDYKNLKLKVITKNTAGNILNQTPKEGLIFRVDELLPIVKDCLSLIQNEGQIVCYFKQKWLTGKDQDNNFLSVDLTVLGVL